MAKEEKDVTPKGGAGADGKRAELDPQHASGSFNEPEDNGHTDGSRERLSPSSIVDNTVVEDNGDIFICPSAGFDYEQKIEPGDVKAGNSEHAAAMEELKFIHDVSSIGHDTATNGRNDNLSTLMKKYSAKDYRSVASEEVSLKVSGPNQQEVTSDGAYRGCGSETKSDLKRMSKRTMGKNYRFKYPISPNYNASADYELHNETLFSNGQVIKYDVDCDSDRQYPIKCTDSEGEEQVISQPLHKSNYMPKYFDFTFKNGKLKKVECFEDEFVVSGTNRALETATHHAILDANNVHDVISNINNKYSNGQCSNYSYLSLGGEDRYPLHLYFHDMMSMTGANMATAVKACNLSQAFQKTVYAKEGQRDHVNAISMLAGGFKGILTNSAQYPHGVALEDIMFSKEAMQAGAPTIFYQLEDNARNGKYNSKSLILTAGEEKSWYQAINNGNRYIHNFRVKDWFMNALDDAITFGTDDGKYNPLSPIYTTHVLKLVNPISFAESLKDWKPKDTVTDADRKQGYSRVSGLKSVYSYRVVVDDNPITRYGSNYLLEGLLEWISDNEIKIAKAIGGDGNTEKVWHVPCEFNFTHPSTFQLILCAAANKIVKAQDKMYADFFKLVSDNGYMWKDLYQIDKESNISNVYNYSQVKTDGFGFSPAKVGKLKISSVLRKYFDDSAHYMGGVNSLGADSYDLLMPWYMSGKGYHETFQDEIDGFGNVGNNERFGMFSTFTRRVGISNRFTKYFFSLNDNMRRQCFDILLDPLPLVKVTRNANSYITRYERTAKTNMSKMHLYSYKYDHFGTNGRMVISYKDAPIKPEIVSDTSSISENVLLCEAAYMVVPREFGVRGRGVRIKQSYFDMNEDSSPLITGNPFEWYLPLDGSTPRAIVSFRQEFDSNDVRSEEHGAAKYQVFYTFNGDRKLWSINRELSEKTGLALTPRVDNVTNLHVINQINSNKVPYDEEDPDYHPSTIGGTSTSGDLQFKYLWTMMNRVSFAINPYINATEEPVVDSHLAYLIDRIDNATFAFIMNMGDFVASDFSSYISMKVRTYDKTDTMLKDETLHSSPILSELKE